MTSSSKLGIVKPGFAFGLSALLLASLAFVDAERWRTPSQSAPSVPSSGEPRPVAAAERAEYVGSEACAGCHDAEYAAWRSSDHRRAMEPATAESVLGDFDGAVFAYYGRTTRFSKRGSLFQVTTENQQGQLETFTIAYTLGHDPLQQYLVAFDDGRIQALPFAWDTR